MLETHLYELIGFLAFVAFATWLDLYVLHKDDHDISLKEAAITSAVWIAIALLFSGYIYWEYGQKLWLEYLSGYTLEKALSVDNIFVIALIFGAFKIRGGLQHRALAWGIIGAIIMRGILIVLGVELVETFTWLLPVFGVFLLFTGAKMLFSKEEHESDITESKVYKWTAKIIPVYPGFDGNKILTKQNGKTMLTMLGIAIVMVEATDLIFAVDSIPAVMGLTRDPFIILTSNVFAILGLRALYFLLAGILHKFRFLKVGLALVLVFIGGKMVALAMDYHMKTEYSLGIILAVLVISIVASLAIPDPNAHKDDNDSNVG